MNTSVLQINNIGIWTSDLEGMKNFYVHYFNASTDEPYYNHTRDFKSYLLHLNQECTIELMHMPGILPLLHEGKKHFRGMAHFDLLMEDAETINGIVQQMKRDGFKVIRSPGFSQRQTYKAAIADPENNHIQLVALH